MFTLHPFKQAEIDKKKADNLRKRTIMGYDLQIDFMKFQSVFTNLNVDGCSAGKSTGRKQEKLLNDQVVEKIRQHKLYYQNEELKIQQNCLITKILQTGSSKFHYLRNEFPKYSLYLFINEYDDTMLNYYYKKVKENKEKLYIAQYKLTEFIKLLNISKIQEEKKSKDEQLKSKFYKEHKNKKKSDQFLLSNKITVEIIKYIDQLINNFQIQQEQINESQGLSKKICYLFINEEILSINAIVEKMKKYFRVADEIESVVKFKRKYKLIKREWKNAREKLKENEITISKETNQIELQKLHKQKYILNNNVNHLKYKIAYFYVKLIIFCNDDSKETLNKLLEEYKNLNINLKDLHKHHREILMKIHRYNDIILDLETKIEADYYDKNNNTLYRDIIVSAKTLIKDENIKNHSKSVISVIIDKIKKKVESKTTKSKNDSESGHSTISRQFFNHTIGIHEQLNYNEENLILYQFLKPEQYKDVIEILTKKRHLKVSESKQSHIVIDRCDSEIESIDKMLDKLNEKMEKDLSSKKSEEKNEGKSEEKSEGKGEDVASMKCEEEEEIKEEDSSKSEVNSKKKQDDDDIELADSSSCNMKSEYDSDNNDISDIEGCPKINFKDYLIQSLISEGGFGSIYKAVDIKTNKKVVIKTFTYNIKKEDIIRIVKISNTNIIGLAKTIGYHFAVKKDEIDEYKNKIKDFNKYFQNGCIIMDLYEKTSLDYYNKNYLELNGRVFKINPTIRSKVIFGVAAIMKKLHEKQIVHRDLKISNILLNDNNEPIICDFDLSYNVNDENFEKHINKGDDLQGTPYYISPEKINNDEDKTNTFASDVYSYAMILYFMFSNSFEFSYNHKKNFFIFYKLIQEGRRPVKPKNIPEHYWELIQMCWNTNPYERPTFKDITDILKDDKYALEEFGMETDLDELHEYQRKLGEYDEPILLCT